MRTLGSMVSMDIDDLMVRPRVRDRRFVMRPLPIIVGVMLIAGSCGGDDGAAEDEEATTDQSTTPIEQTTTTAPLAQTTTTAPVEQTTTTTTSSTTTTTTTAATTTTTTTQPEDLEPALQLPTFEDVVAQYPDGQTCETEASLLARNADGSFEVEISAGTLISEEMIEFPCWGLRFTTVVEMEVLGTSYPAGSVLVVGPDSDPAVLVDIEPTGTMSMTVEPVVGTWTPTSDGLTLVRISE